MTTTKTETGWTVRWASTHIGVTHGEYLSDGQWEDDGFSVDDDGKPERDSRGNTLSHAEETPFDAGNPDHVTLAVDYATSDGCQDRDELHDFLVRRLGIPAEEVDSRLEDVYETGEDE